MENIMKGDMKTEEKLELKIDPEFRDKIPPLTNDEFRRLKENIIADGKVRDPIVIWNSTIVDGHNRWKIIQEHPELPYTVEEKDFPDRYAAVAWICSNQLGRRNLTDEQRTYLLGKEYEAQRQSRGAQVGNDNAKKQIGQFNQFELVKKSRNSTRTLLAQKHGVTELEVRYAAEFSKGLDHLATVEPELKEQILKGEKKVPKSKVAELRKLEKEGLKVAVEKIKNYKRPEAKKPPLPKIEISAEHETREMTVDDAASSFRGTLHQFVLTLDRLKDDYRDFVDEDPQRFKAIVQCTIDEFMKIKEEL